MRQCTLRVFVVEVSNFKVTKSAEVRPAGKISLMDHMWMWVWMLGWTHTHTDTHSLLAF